MIIAETFLQLGTTVDPTTLDSRARSLLKTSESIARTYYLRARRLEVEVAVRVEEGSTKAWVAVLASVAMIYKGIAEYGSFREGIDYIWHDAKEIGRQLVTEAPAALGRDTR